PAPLMPMPYKKSMATNTPTMWQQLFPDRDRIERAREALAKHGIVISHDTDDPLTFIQHIVTAASSKPTPAREPDLPSDVPEEGHTGPGHSFSTRTDDRLAKTGDRLADVANEQCHSGGVGGPPSRVKQNKFNMDTTTRDRAKQLADEQARLLGLS